MWLDRGLRCNVIKISHSRNDGNVLWTIGHIPSGVHERLGESEIKIMTSLNLGDILSTQLQAKSLNIRFQMLNLATTANWILVRCLKVSGCRNFASFTEIATDLLHRICNCNARERDAVALCNVLQDFRNLLLTSKQRSRGHSACASVSTFRILKLTHSHNSPSMDGHSFVTAHWNNFSF